MCSLCIINYHTRENILTRGRIFCYLICVQNEKWIWAERNKPRFLCYWRAHFRAPNRPLTAELSSLSLLYPVYCPLSPATAHFYFVSVHDLKRAKKLRGYLGPIFRSALLGPEPGPQMKQKTQLWFCIKYSAVNFLRLLTINDCR